MSDTEAMKALDRMFRRLDENDTYLDWSEDRDIVAAALAATNGYDWVDRTQGYEDGVNEMAHELKQLCKDFSDLRDRPYMGDVFAQIDAVAERCLQEIPQHHRFKPAAEEAKETTND